MKHILVKKEFSKKASQLRAYFEDQFASAQQANPKRFVWDYWHVPDQYTLLRTPAYHYFPEKIYVDFHSQLVQWGRENLGCHDISPPWMSLYVDGCKQDLHSDVPHGPWAFVYSLTPWKGRVFQGGETFILKPQILSYWKHFSDQREYEQKAIVDRIPAHFNQLTVFDPRYPHGVTEVKGTKDPLQGRLVIHGWFVQPRPYVVGALSTKDVDGVLQEVLFHLQRALNEYSPFHGTLSVQCQVSAQGHVTAIKFLTNTLMSMADQEKETQWLRKDLIAILKASSFPKRRGPSRIVLPLVFKSS